jgi:hypothetical protein
MPLAIRVVADASELPEVAGALPAMSGRRAMQNQPPETSTVP